MSYQPKVYKKDSGDTLIVASGGEIDIESGGSLKLDGTAIEKTATELNTVYVFGEIADISTAGSSWTITPVAGEITKIETVIDGTIATSDAALTFELGGTAITGGGITITASGSAAGDIDTAAPSAANTVTAGQAIEMITDGASTNTVKAKILFTIVMS